MFNSLPAEGTIDVFRDGAIPYETEDSIAPPLEVVQKISLEWATSHFIRTSNLSLTLTETLRYQNIEKLISLGEHIIDFQLLLMKYFSSTFRRLDSITQSEFDILIKYSAYIHPDILNDIESRSLDDLSKSWRKSVKDPLSQFIQGEPINHIILQYMDIEKPWVEKLEPQETDISELDGFSRHRSVIR